MLALMSRDIFSHFVVTVLVRLTEPITLPTSADGDEPSRVVGYYMNLGVSDLNESSARTLISDLISDGEIDWEKTRWRDFSDGQENPPMQTGFDTGPKPGVWYRSGRILFPDTND
ncbi:MAG TPA: hypothetical protein VI454_01360 [Verrucomicrobiae bacterium]|jgi:hypothetical protein